MVFALEDKKQIIFAYMDDFMAREHYRKAFSVRGNSLDKTAKAIYRADQKIHVESKVTLVEIGEYFRSLYENPNT